jgi:SulP family sulfate permease
MIAFLEARKAGLFSRGEIWRTVVAGVIVGIVALPLAMAFAIASGASRSRVSTPRSSRTRDVGARRHARADLRPTGAFIRGARGGHRAIRHRRLQAATLMAGVHAARMGYPQLRQRDRFIPNPVIVGFTSGIAVHHLGRPVERISSARRRSRPAGIFTRRLALIRAAGMTWRRRASRWDARDVVVRQPAARRIPGSAGARRRSSPCSPRPRSRQHWQFPGVATIGTAFGGIPASCRRCNGRRSR